MTIDLDIRNVAGIRSAAATLQPGVNAVRGLNWQGKTSFVRAIETAMGTAAALTEGASEGRVELVADDERVDVSLSRNGDAVVMDGTPYLDDEYDRICADLYAFLDDENEVRAAVRRGNNLEDVLTRPLEFEDIDARLADLQDERERVEAELERARDAARDLSDVQARVTQLEDELQQLRSERADILDSRGEHAETADGNVREQLSEARAERSRLEDRIERLRDAIDRIESELASLRADREAIDVPDVSVEADIESLREELDAIEHDKDLVQGLYSANKRILEEGRLDLVSELERGLVSDEVDCWVCGAETETADIEARIDQLGDRLSELDDQAAEYRDRIESLEEQRSAVRRAREERRDLDREIADLEGTLTDRRESLEHARDQLSAVENRIDDLAERVAEGQERLTDLQSEIKYTEDRLTNAREELEELHRQADRQDSLETTLEEIRSDLEKLRGRKSRIKQEMRNAFDEAITDIVRRFETSFESAHLTGNFNLVVARDGREISLDALSEGELELLGIVTALAGHKAYDVGARVPVLVLDGVGGLAAQNLKTLVEYLDGRSEYLVFTAHPEYTGFDGHELRPSEWTVVSDEPDMETRT